MGSCSQVCYQRGWLATYYHPTLLHQNRRPCMPNCVATRFSCELASRRIQGFIDLLLNPIIVQAGATQELSAVIYLILRYSKIFNFSAINNRHGKYNSRKCTRPKSANPVG